MPVDAYEDDDPKEQEAGLGGKKYKDFDCPNCNANNPRDEIISDGDELLCNYCGTEFSAKLTEDGRLKLKEL